MDSDKENNLSDGDYADSGSEYVISREPSSSDDTDAEAELAELRSNQQPSTSSDSTISNNLKSKKRVRNPANWKRSQLKLKRAKGEEYVNRKNNVVAAKTAKVGPCPCNKKCHLKINDDRQREIFSKFYALANFDLQNSYVFSLVTVLKKSRSYAGVTSRRDHTNIFHLLDDNGIEVIVCKQFFLRTLQISDGRVTRVLKKKINDTVPPIDQRGRKSSVNKTPEIKVLEVKEFINKFPVYESHYTRHKSENRRYLAPDLSLGKLYSLYKEKTTQPLSQFMFSKIFNECFNLRFHAPISDSCKKCDLFENKLKCTVNEIDRRNLQLERELHQRKADSAREGLKTDTELSKTSDVTVITFDLMKTLPTPVLTTGIVYYKRQLWTFCFGIHDMGTDQGYMYVWNESLASRGPPEIGSCLLHFFKHYVKTKKVIMYSDQCGGQNRNIKMALLCQFIVSSPDYEIEDIDHKFLVSGHSYLPCDQDFGLIEKNKKFYKEIYTPDCWIPVIENARKNQPFKVIKMEKQDFICTKSLEKNITNRKLSERNGKVEWLKIQWLKFHKMHPFSIFYKYSNQEDVLFEEVNIKNRKSKTIHELEILEKSTIAEKKKKDLIELLQFIPPIYHDFYLNLHTAASQPDVVYNDSDSDDE